MSRVEQSLTAEEPTGDFARQLCGEKGVSGYVLHTVPVAIHCWLSNSNDYRTAVMEIIRCGGDTDTTAAIVGAIIGSGVGREGIPQDWLNGIKEWPKSVSWMEKVAEATQVAINTGKSLHSLRTLPFVTLVRNTIFLAVVLAHAVRRLLPPY